jgi:hypothetical protein
LWAPITGFKCALYVGCKCGLGKNMDQSNTCMRQIIFKKLPKTYFKSDKRIYTDHLEN